MNPIRAMFLSLSRMPPVVMLLIIIGMAVVVTMMITGKVNQQEAKLQEQAGDAEYVVMSSKTIPAHTEIDKTMIVQRRAYSSEVWSDAIMQKSNAIGRTTDKLIPANCQIREADLQ